MRPKDSLKKDERVINVVTRYVKRQTSKIFVSDKKCLTQKYDWINVMLVVVVREGDVNQIQL